jgi:pimeloyl-ACP methyl ester carboxylesterase
MASRTPRGKAGASLHSEQTAAVIDDLGLKDAILIGHSMGADVILEALRRVKSRVWGLVLVDQHRQLSEFMTETQVLDSVLAWARPGGGGAGVTRRRGVEQERWFAFPTFQIDVNILHGWPAPRCAHEHVCGQWGTVCHHVEWGSAASSHRASSEGGRVQREAVPSGHEPDAP